MNNILSPEEFTLLYDFLHSRKVYPQSETEGLLLAIVEFGKVDLSKHFGGHYDDIDERFVYVFNYLKFETNESSCSVRARLDIGRDILIANSPFKEDRLSGIAKCVVETIRFVNKYGN